MPAIDSGKVLVTGANGYIASWIVLTLLQQGYSVRGTVRTAEKGEGLKQSMLKREPAKAKNFEYVVIIFFFVTSSSIITNFHQING